MSVSLSTGLGARLISSDTNAKPFDKLPIIDLTNINSSKLEDRKALAAEIQAACIDIGFFLISNHGIPQDVFDNAFSESKKFFDQPLEKKMEVDLHKGTSFKGYAPLMGEQVDPASRGDVHEAWDMGAEDQSMAEGRSSANMWPSETDLPGFKPAMTAAWNHIMSLGRRLFPFFALALDLPEDYFDPYLTNPGSVMRTLYYAPQEGAYDARELGIGAHSDYELVTYLVQNGDVPALQVLDVNGDWVSVPPVPGTIVVNLGDLLQRMTNDVFKSTIHRAINRSGRARQSMPFFFGPNYDALIEPLPSCVSPSNPARYEPVIAGKYVEQRLAETYVKVEPAKAAATA